MGGNGSMGENRLIKKIINKIDRCWSILSHCSKIDQTPVTRKISIKEQTKITVEMYRYY